MTGDVAPIFNSELHENVNACFTEALLFPKQHKNANACFIEALIFPKQHKLFKKKKSLNHGVEINVSKKTLARIYNYLPSIS